MAAKLALPPGIFGPPNAPSPLPLVTPLDPLPLTAPHAGPRGRRIQEACGHMRRPREKSRDALECVPLHVVSVAIFRFPGDIIILNRKHCVLHNDALQYPKTFLNALTPELYILVLRTLTYHPWNVVERH